MLVRITAAMLAVLTIAEARKGEVRITFYYILAKMKETRAKNWKSRGS